MGAAIAPFAAGHDRAGTFVSEAYERLRDAGLLAVGVPEELGGGGATIREVAAMQHELARHCASTALASAMHQHVVAFTSWKYHHGASFAEATLRRVVDEGIILASTGGADLTHPRGTATKVDGGYVVSGTKGFVSQSPVGAAMSTMFAFDDPERGLRVLNMAVPMSDGGVQVLDDWDSLGMRGTGSNSVVVDSVFVPEEKVIADRPHGRIDPPLQVLLSIALPIVTSVYLGTASAAADAAIAAATTRADDPVVQRQVGLMRHRLQVARWALDAALDVVGDDPEPSEDRLLAVLSAKREVTLAANEVCDLAIDVAGGSAYFRGSVIERSYRDVRAAAFHPLTPELTLLRMGQHALGLELGPS